MKRSGNEAGGIALLEQAVLLLRATPASTWAIYLLGSIPFVTGLFWFSVDSLRNLYAPRHLLAHSLAIAGLFLWKQVTEGLFLSRLSHALNGTTGRVEASGIARAALRQAAVQPSGFITLPFALISGLPAPFTLFFYRNFSLYALEDPPGALRRAWSQARRFQGQAWVFLSVLLLGIVLLYVNLLTGLLITAQLAKSVFGVEELLSDPLTLLHSGTVHAGILLITGMCADLILDAAAALRCFYGDSIHSGADILAGLRRMAAGAALLAVLMGGASLRAQVDQRALDQSIDRTLERAEFAWRMPGAGQTPEAVNWFVSAIEKISELAGKAVRALAEWLRPKGEAPGEGASAQGIPEWMRVWLYVLAAAAAAGIAAVYWRSRRGGRRTPTLSAAAEIRPANVRDESVLADQLTEDLWLRAADELIARGEYRLALRAMHLAGLRFLADRQLVRIARWKSGLEYLSELRRRTRHKAGMGEAFGQNLRLFDLGWYGFHAVEPPMLDEFRRHLEEMRGYVG